MNYRGNERSNARLHYAKHETGEVFLTKAEVILQDGAVNVHVPQKGMGVGFTPTFLDAIRSPLHFPPDEH